MTAQNHANGFGSSAGVRTPRQFQALQHGGGEAQLFSSAPGHDLGQTFGQGGYQQPSLGEDISPPGRIPNGNLSQQAFPGLNYQAQSYQTYDAQFSPAAHPSRGQKRRVPQGSPSNTNVVDSALQNQHLYDTASPQKLQKKHHAHRDGQTLAYSTGLGMGEQTVDNAQAPRAMADVYNPTPHGQSSQAPVATPDHQYQYPAGDGGQILVPGPGGPGISEQTGFDPQPPKEMASVHDASPNGHSTQQLVAVSNPQPQDQSGHEGHMDLHTQEHNAVPNGSSPIANNLFRAFNLPNLDDDEGWYRLLVPDENMAAEIAAQAEAADASREQGVAGGQRQAN